MRSAPSPRGSTLLEVMIALSILAVGLLAMMRLQVLGFTSNQGARAQMEAAELAQELAAALERLPFTDARLAATSSFGSLLTPSAQAGAVDYADFAAITGVRPESAIPALGGAPVYERRWTVQSVAGGTAKIVAVSVVYRERTIALPREVLIYVGKVDAGNVGGDVAAYN